MPEHLDWHVWRVVTSPRMTVTKTEIEERWSVSDLLDAHEVLDMYDDLEARAAKKGGR